MQRLFQLFKIANYSTVNQRAQKDLAKVKQRIVDFDKKYPEGTLEDLAATINKNTQPTKTEHRARPKKLKRAKKKKKAKLSPKPINKAATEASAQFKKCVEEFCTLKSEKQRHEIRLEMSKSWIKIVKRDPTFEAMPIEEGSIAIYKQSLTEYFYRKHKVTLG